MVGLSWVLKFLPAINKTYLIIGGLVISWAVAGLIGWKGASYSCNAEKLEAIERALEQQAELQKEVNEIEREFIEEEAKTEVVYKYINKEVIKYVENNSPVECLTPDGVLLWNHANSGKYPPESAD